MVKQNASLDASFWINAYDADLIRFLLDYFRLFVCRSVAGEIRYPLDVLGIKEAACPSLFVEWCKSGIITLEDPRKPVNCIWQERMPRLPWLSNEDTSC